MKASRSTSGRLHSRESEVARGDLLHAHLGDASGCSSSRCCFNQVSADAATARTNASLRATIWTKFGYFHWLTAEQAAAAYADEAAPRFGAGVMLATQWIWITRVYPTLA
jgi:hypothetical protein